MAVVVAPLVTVAGDRRTELRIGGRTVRVPEGEAPPYVAVIVTGVETVTCAVVMLNVAYVAPAATLTVAGTAAVTGSELERLTTAPPVGAGPFRFTRWDVEAVPPATEAGWSTTEEATSGTTVKLTGLLTPAKAPAIVAGVESLTLVVVIVNAT